MKLKLILASIGLAFVLLFAFPMAVGAISGQDALLGLIEVLKSMVKAYTEYLGAL